MLYFESLFNFLILLGSFSVNYCVMEFIVGEMKIYMMGFGWEIYYELWDLFSCGVVIRSDFIKIIM